MSVGEIILAFIAACATLGLMPPLIWRGVFKRRSGLGFFIYSLVAFGLMIGLGLLGLVAGFLGPLLYSHLPQGPLLALFSTPLGVFCGMLFAWIWFYATRHRS